MAIDLNDPHSDTIEAIKAEFVDIIPDFETALLAM